MKKTLITLLLPVFILTACKSSPVSTLPIDPAPHHEVIYTRSDSRTPYTIMRARSDGSEKRVIAEGTLITAPVNGRILFTRRSNLEFYSGSIDGGEPTRIDIDSYDARWRERATLSPDGLHFLAVHRNQTDWGVDELWIWKLDGTNGRFIASSSPYSESIFSPDGRRIAFFDRSKQLFTINVDGTGQIAMADPPASPAGDRGKGTMSWSPNGEWIAVALPTTGLIEIIHAGGDRSKSLPSFRGYNPVWSPDGAEIAHIDRGWIMIHPIDSVSRGVAGSRNTAGYDVPMLPYWSPDQRRLLYRLSDMSENRQFHSVDITNKSLTFIDDNVMNAYWLP